MNRLRSTDRRPLVRQRGDALIESLVGTVIAAIMGLGLAFTCSRVVVSQRYVTTQSAVLDQMANALSSAGVSNLCAGTTQATVTLSTYTLSLATPTCAEAAITVSTSGGTQSVVLPAGVVTTMTFSTPSSNTTAQNLLGGNGVMTIWQ
jgi:prepilin peptidase dependent protein A